MALAATGAECASAAIAPVAATDAGHYRVEANESNPILPSIVVANHVLAIIAVSHAIALPGANVSEVVTRLAAPDRQGPAASELPFVTSTVPCSFDFPAPIAESRVYDADGRCMASLADANARQLLFVKTTRG